MYYHPCCIILKLIYFFKYELTEKKRIEEKLRSTKLTDEPEHGNKIKISHEERLEIWIRPDGSSSKHTSDYEDGNASEELDMLTDVDVSLINQLKGFTNIFF